MLPCRCAGYRQVSVTGPAISQLQAVARSRRVTSGADRTDKGTILDELSTTTHAFPTLGRAKAPTLRRSGELNVSGELADALTAISAPGGDVETHCWGRHQPDGHENPAGGSRRKSPRW